MNNTWSVGFDNLVFLSKHTVLARVEYAGTRLMTGALLTKMLEYLPILQETSVFVIRIDVSLTKMYKI